MRKSISWILNFTGNLPNNKEKVACLQANDTPALRTILKYALDPNIEWLLPEGEPPYVPCQFPNQESNLYNEVRKLYIYIKGGNDNLHQVKRERLFIQLLETVDPQDAKLLLSIKEKKLPYDIPEKVILKAFPGLF